MANGAQDTSVAVWPAEAGYVDAQYNDPMQSRGLGLGDKAAFALLVIAGLVGVGLWKADLDLTIALGVAGSLGFVAIMISPLMGVTLLLVLLPMEGLTSEQGATASKFIAIATALSFLPRLVTGMDIRRCFASQTYRWMLIMLGWGILILPMADGVTQGLVSLGLEAEMAGLALLFAAVPRNFGQLRFVCVIGALGGGILGLYGVALGGGPGVDSDRLSMGTNPNGLAVGLAICLLAAAVAWGASGKFLRYVVIPAIGLFIVAAIGMSNSLNTWISLGLCMLASLVCPGVARKTKFTIVGVALLVMVIGFSLVFFNVFGDTQRLVTWRVERIASGGETSGGRLDTIWPHYMNVIERNPLIGGGPGKLFVDDMSSHNDFIFVASEKGIPGVILLLAFIVAAARESFRNRDEWLRLISWMIVVFTFSAGFAHWTFLSKPYAVCIGLLACLSNPGLLAGKGAEPLEYEYDEAQAGAWPEGTGDAAGTPWPPLRPQLPQGQTTLPEVPRAQLPKL